MKHMIGDANQESLTTICVIAYLGLEGISYEHEEFDDSIYIYDKLTTNQENVIKCISKHYKQNKIQTNGKDN